MNASRTDTIFVPDWHDTIPLGDEPRSEREFALRMRPQQRQQQLDDVGAGIWAWCGAAAAIAALLALGWSLS